jgi:hypothetical protein
VGDGRLRRPSPTERQGRLDGVAICDSAEYAARLTGEHHQLHHRPLSGVGDEEPHQERATALAKYG